jgi:hypothetical protein
MTALPSAGDALTSARLLLADVCEATVTALRADGAAATLFGSAGPSLVLATDRTADALDRAQQTIGEGPSMAAFTSQTAVIIQDLRGEDARRRWPGLAGVVAPLAVGRFLAFPMGVGGIRLGVLSVYSRGAGPLSVQRLPAALLAADAAALALLDAERESGGVVRLAELGPVRDYRIHQATGMVMGQTGQNAHDALTTLRARAFTDSASLQRLAGDVLAGRMRFDPEDR